MVVIGDGRDGNCFNNLDSFSIFGDNHDDGDSHDYSLIVCHYQPLSDALLASCLCLAFHKVSIENMATRHWRG